MLCGYLAFLSMVPLVTWHFTGNMLSWSVSACRKWNQFEANESLFGVKSTFDEELYTTKLERGTQTKELEEQARRIANEIEGETTRDLHVAEVIWGFYLHLYSYVFVVVIRSNF